MHIVVLTGNYYPNSAAPSACIKPYLLELVKDNEVEVICPMSDIRFDRETLLDGINVHFVTHWLNRLQTVTAGKFRQFLGRMINYGQEVFAPTPYNPMLVKAYLEKLGEISSEREIDAIISVTFPFYTHVVALRYKQSHPEVKWLSYTTDPLAFNEANPIPAWKKKRAMRIEQEVYDHCDYCLITEELTPNLIEDYHIPQQKLVILPYLLEVEDASIETASSEKDRAQVIYAGFLFHRVRNPRVMLAAFSGLRDVDLQLYVAGDRIIRKMLRRPLPQNITIHGLVPRSEYFKLLNRADVLINLSNNARLQAPHKLMELVSTGKPIINFFYYQDAGHQIIGKYPLGINVSCLGEITEMTDAIASFISEKGHLRLAKSEIEALYPENQLPAQMERVRAILNN